MNIVSALVDYPCWFWLVAIIWSILQGYAGYWYGLYLFDASPLNINDSSGSNKPKRSKYVRWFAYGGHHAAFYFLCSLSGFIAGGLAYEIANRISNWNDISGGTAAMLTALLVIAVSGVSGGLARILFLGGKP